MFFLLAAKSSIGGSESGEQMLFTDSSGLGLAAQKRGYYLAGRLYWACRRSHWDLHIIHRGFPGTSQLNIAI